MKKFLNYAAYISLFVVALNFTSCQDEFEEINTGEEPQAIMANSSTATLVKNTSTNDGSFDNIVDGASCFDIKFPYTVTVNGIELTLDTREDLHIIEEIFDAIDNDEDFLEILFPITITTGDFTEITINGIEDLRELAAQCKEGGEDEDIECIDFVYPMTLFIFDINLQQTGSVLVESDRDLRRFFGGLDDNDLVSFDFPISLKLYDGTTLEVNSNEELVRAIEDAKDACDEDDDDDYNDDDFDEERLDFCLTECPWYVKEIRRNDVEQTAQYTDYIFDFMEDGTVNVKDRAGMNVTGTWESRVGDNGAVLVMEFETLVDFTLEWQVYEIDDHRIKLFNGESNRIVMKQICEEDVVPANPDTLREILRECEWIIKKVKNQGEEIDRLLGYEFKFMSEGVVTLSNGMNTSEGTWEIGFNEEQKLVMAITMGDEPGVSFEWPVRDLANKRLKFEVEEIGYELVLERNCDDNEDDRIVPQIREVLINGDWSVTTYIEGDINKTEIYGGYSIQLMEDHQISIKEGGEAFGEGLWRVLRNSEERLKVYLNFGANMPFDELTDDWLFVSMTSVSLELIRLNEDGTTDILIMER
ncbi:hypothetical protein EJ994_09015 [Maribacter sp. MJ134]|uniref:hypothetical protein n=1 Tax=Maribacter sp. MJ134 TaxID=2496865 RepID=UPI000F81DACC|nr:hypothetical protein [Maribacter sp. MJ134]AZQ58941.1 hypothetical protein EJ994_09015 [Maribacter sp. MJ134]